MADLKMRPRFTVDVASDVETVVQALRERVGDSDPPLEGYFNTAHCVLGIPAERRYLYSPELELTFESAGSDAGAGGVRVRALVGPRPAVWTAFVYLYAVLALIGLGGALYGVAQLTLGEPPASLLVPAAALVAMGIVYGSTFIGQGLAAAQTYELRRFLDECLEHAEQRARAAPRSPFDSAGL